MSYGDFVTRYACGHETRVTMFAFGPGPDVISTKARACSEACFEARLVAARIADEARKVAP